MFCHGPSTRKRARNVGLEGEEYTLSGGRKDKQATSVDNLRSGHFQSRTIKGSEADDDWMKRGRGEDRGKPTRGASMRDWGR